MKPMKLVRPSVDFFISMDLGFFCFLRPGPGRYNWGGEGGKGGKGRGEQLLSLCTNTLMWDLGTRLEYRQTVFVRTEKTLWKRFVEVNQ